MKSKILVASIVLFFTCINFSIADEGCYYGSSGYIYYTSDGTYLGKKNFAYQYGPGGSRVHNSAVYCITYSSTVCRIDKANGVDGTLVTFSYLGCPIDDYIPYMLLVVGGIGFSFLRKKQIIFP